MRRLVGADTIVTGTGAVYEGALLLVEDGRIAAIGMPDDFGADARDVEANPGATIIPGFVDSHAHLEFTPLPDHDEVIQRFASDDTEDRLGAVALHHAQLALSGGVTTLRDCGSTFSLLAVRDLVAEGLPGPRILACGPPITTTAGHLFWVGRRADTRDQVRIAVRELLERGVDAIKIVATGGQMTKGTNQLMPQYSVEELRTCVEEAHRLGRLVVAHVLSVAAIELCLDAGVDSIDHARWQQADGSTCYEPALGARLARSSTMVGLTGSGWTRKLLKQGDTGWRQLVREFAAHRRLFEAGAAYHLQSDAGTTETAFERFGESIAMMTIALGATSAQALAAATIRSAQAVGLDREVGSLEAGKRADYLVLDGNPLDNLAALSRIRRVVRDGIPLVEDGRIMLRGSAAAMERP